LDGAIQKNPEESGSPIDLYSLDLGVIVKIVIRSFVAIFSILLSSQGLALQSKYSSGAQDFAITNAQRDQLMRSALDGSGDAAFHLFRFYAYTLDNLDEALRWAIIGAENGDANCQYSAAIFLNNKNSPGDKKRSLFWLKKAASQGLKIARQELDRYEKDGEL
jgi:TPR repeat protein